MPNPHSTPRPPLPATWAWSLDHGKIRCVVDSHDLWGDIQLRIWLPALDATVQPRPDRLFPHSESAAALRLAEDCPARRKFQTRLQGETNKRGP